MFSAEKLRCFKRYYDEAVFLKALEYGRNFRQSDQPNDANKE
jgi:hypothetical protein